MDIPGSDLLDIAFDVISKTDMTYRRFMRRALLANGNWLPIYYGDVILLGSWQPVARNVYRAQGLDFQKSYFNFFVSNDLIDIHRDVSGDHLIKQGKEYQCESLTPWFGIDGWNKMLCTEVNDAPLYANIGYCSGYSQGYGLM